MPQTAPLTPDDRTLLKSLYQALRDEPLEPESPRYEPVYGGLGPDDPVELLHQHIEWNDTHSVQMLSGFSGSGKTTELLRLRGRLRESGYRVVYADALEYLNPSQPIDITELLIVIAGSFSDGLKEEGIDVSGEGYWTRLTNYLTKTNVGLEGFDAGAGGVDLKFKLRTTPSFRAKLRDLLTGRVGEMKKQVDLFLQDGIEAVQGKSGQKCVFILDSLEQFRDSAISEEKVMQSVREIFAHHQSLLSLPHLHAVYTVPPWLPFLMPNAVGMVVLPSIRQWNNDIGRTRYEPGWDLLRSAVKRRFGEDACVRVFGEPDGRDNIRGWSD